MQIVSSLIKFAEVPLSFVLFLILRVNFQHDRGEQVLFIIALKSFWWSYGDILMFHLFRIFLCLGLYTVTIFFFETFKNYILKVLIISLQLLISYSLLAQLWVHSPRVNSSDDIELNPRPKRMLINVFQCVTAIWPALHPIILIAHDWIHNLDIVCLSESCLKSEIFSSDSNLLTYGYNFVTMGYLSNTNRRGFSVLEIFLASENHPCIIYSKMYWFWGLNWQQNMHFSHSL